MLYFTGAEDLSQKLILEKKKTAILPEFKTSRQKLILEKNKNAIIPELKTSPKN